MALTTIRDAAAAPQKAAGPAVFSAGFRPFFFLSAVWAAIAVPVWLCVYTGAVALPSALPPVTWHVHEMIFGYAFATIAGFLLTAIPNWTGRLPLRGAPLAALAGLWLAGRIAILFSGAIGPAAAMIVDLAFPVVFAAVVARELIAGRNWRNMPMLAALSVLFAANALVHLHALGIAGSAEAGNRLGLATVLALISLVGGRIVPSFTRNWLAKARPGGPLPAQAGRLDMAALLVTVGGLAAWAIVPAADITPWMELAAGAAAALRLSRWCGLATLAEPLVFILHMGYGWLAVGLLLLGFNGLHPLLPPTTALHALTAGAIGTMTLAVMTRATLGHSGQPLSAAGHGTLAIYVLVTLAALLRLGAPLAGEHAMDLTWAAGAAWFAAFGLFAVLYGRLLMRRRN
jgi:uncharacterized protein involved in response to NO